MKRRKNTVVIFPVKWVQAHLTQLREVLPILDGLSGAPFEEIAAHFDQYVTLPRSAAINATCATNKSIEYMETLLLRLKDFNQASKAVRQRPSKVQKRKTTKRKAARS